MLLLHPWIIAILTAAWHTVRPFLSPISGVAQPASALALCASLTSKNQLALPSSRARATLESVSSCVKQACSHSVTLLTPCPSPLAGPSSKQASLQTDMHFLGLCGAICSKETMREAVVCIRQKVTNLPVTPGNSFLYCRPPTGHCPSRCHELKCFKVKSHVALWPRPPPTSEVSDSWLGGNPRGMAIAAGSAGWSSQLQLRASGRRRELKPPPAIPRLKA